MRLVTFLLCGAWKGTDDLVMFCKWQGRAVEGVGGCKRFPLSLQALSKRSTNSREEERKSMQ